MQPRLIRYGLTALLFALSAVQIEPVHAAPRKTFARRDNVKIPMSDGIALTADVYLPTGKKPFPVVLVRTPYGKRQMGPYLAEPLAERGYAVVMQDVRGMARQNLVRPRRVF